MTTIDYTLLAVFLSLFYGLIVHFWPEFPLSSEVFFTLILALLTKIGVDVIGKPVVERTQVYFAKRSAKKAKALKAVKK